MLHQIYRYKTFYLICVDIRIHDHYNGHKLKNTWLRLGHGNIHVKLFDYLKMNNAFMLEKGYFKFKLQFIRANEFWPVHRRIYLSLSFLNARGCQGAPPAVCRQHRELQKR